MGNFFDEDDDQYRAEDWEAIVEAVLFTMGNSVELKQLAVAIGQSEEIAKRVVLHLQKRYDPFASIRSWAVIAIIIVINLIVIGDFYISTIGNIQAYNSDGGNMFIQAIPVYQNSQIVPVILGIAVFELFRRLNVPNIRVVNFIGASTFMIYLIHDNEFVYKIWDTQDWLTLLHEDVIRFFGIYFVWTLKTFAAGFICYCIFVMGGKLVNIFKPLVIKQTM